MSSFCGVLVIAESRVDQKKETDEGLKAIKAILTEPRTKIHKRLLRRLCMRLRARYDRPGIFTSQNLRYGTCPSYRPGGLANHVKDVHIWKFVFAPPNYIPSSEIRKEIYSDVP